MEAGRFYDYFGVFCLGDVFDRGRLNEKVEPVPTWEENQILPFIFSTSWRTINRPRPVPGVPLTISSSARKKRVKILV